MQGTMFGRYRVVDKLAEGGMGAVYTATHEHLNREVVVKILLPDFSSDKSIVKRFFNEAQAAASIQHPGIVAVLDVGYADDGRAYIVMEKLPGESLQARLDRMHRLEPAHASALIRQLAGAVGAAHERGIIHRDLKPANVFVVPDPEVPGGERIKVLDFGLAKLLIGRGSLATHTGSIFGTPAYMAPEQCMDARSVDHRADLYAIGCMFYACVCGRPPFVSNNPMQVMLAHMNETAPPPRSLQPALPPYHEGLILNLMQKRPDDRLPSCAALIEALDHGAVLFGGSGGLVQASTALATGSSPGARPGPASSLGHAQTAAPSASHVLGHAQTAAPSASHALGHAPTAAPSASHALGHAPTAAPSASHAFGHAPTAAPSAPYAPAPHPSSPAPPSAPHAFGHVPPVPPSAPAHPPSAPPPASYAPVQPHSAPPPVMTPAVAQSAILAGAGNVQTAQAGAPRRSRWPLIAGAAAVLTIVGLAAALFHVMTREPATQVVVTGNDSAPPPTQAQVDEQPVTGAPADAPAQGAASAAAAAPSGAAARPKPALAALPGNAQMVARIDVPRVMASPFYQSLFLPALSAQYDQRIGSVMRACGDDRIKALKTITVAAVGEDRTSMVVEGLTREALTLCLRGMASAAGESWEVRQEGNFTVASSKAPKGNYWFGWLGDRAFVTGADAQDKAAVAGMLDDKDGVDGNKRTMALIDSTDQKAAIWLVMHNAAPAGGGMAHVGTYVSIDVAGGLALTVGLRHTNDKAAEATATVFRTQLKELQGTPYAASFGATRVQVRGNDVILSLRLGEDVLEQILQGNGNGMDAESLGDLLDM